MPKLREGWLTVGLLCAMIMVAAWGIAIASWAEGLWAGWFTGSLGVIAGLALAKSRFSGPRAALFATVYGVFFVGFFIAAMLQGTWHERSLELINRLGVFIYKVIFGGTSRDALPFPVLTAALFWTMGVVGAWSIFRRGAFWPAVIPGGLALLVNAYYYLGPAAVDAYLAVYLLLALLLLGRVSLLAREQEWRTARVAYSQDTRLDFLRAGLAVALAGVMIGWAGPELTASPEAVDVWRQMTGPWSAVREQWMRLFAAVRAYGQTVNDFYGDTLTLGGPARLSTAPIVDVTVGLVDETGPEAGETGKVLRYYWRAAAYEEYYDGRWVSSGDEFKEFNPEEAPAFRLPAYRLRREVRATFTTHVAASSRLYVLPQPRWVDRPVTFELVSTPGGTVEIGSVRSRDILHRGAVYQTIASVSVADEQSLRDAGTLYPGWVVERYLQLPVEVTDRTRQLARDIVEAAGAETPFDQAQAITDWLRRNIRYDQNVAIPPRDVEPIDYLLFDTLTGYCNYYASAEVILLRSLGIPARLAVGMSEGTFDARTGIYHVIEQNAHAWPEVFFPSYGWVEFEPTVSEPPLVRPERRPNSPPTDFDAPPPDRDQPLLDDEFLDREKIEEGLAAGPEPLGLSYWMTIGQAMGRTAAFILGGAVLLALAGVGLLIYLGVIGWESLGGVGGQVLRWRGLPVPSAVAGAYLRLERTARWLRLPASEADTPHERAALLGEAIPEARAGVNTITDQYVAERYSPHPSDEAEALAAWAGIRLTVWRERLRALGRRWLAVDLSQLFRRVTGRGSSARRFPPDSTARR